MKKRIAAVFFVACIAVLLMLTAGFEQSDRLSMLGYLTCSAVVLGGMYISGTAAGIIEKKKTPAARRNATSVRKENVKLKTPIL